MQNSPIAESGLALDETLLDASPPARPLLRELFGIVGAAAIAGLGFAVADIVRATSAVPGAVDLQTGLAVLGLWLCFAQMLGVVTWAIRLAVAKVGSRIPRSQAALGLSAAFICVAIAVFAWKLRADGGFRHATRLRAYAPWVVALAVALSSWLALRFTERSSFTRSMRLGACLASLVSAVSAAELDARLAGGFLYIHVVLVAFAVICATDAAERLSLPPLVGRAALVSTLLCLPSLVTFPATREARELLVQPTWAGLQLVDYAQFHADFDRDGHSAIFGGDDCDDSDAARFVGAPERAADGHDSNCDGVDDPRPPTLTFAPYHGTSEIEARQIGERAKGLPTVVVMIDALRFDRVGSARFPGLALLARESLSVRRAYATSSTTLSSVPAMMSGHVRPRPDGDNIVRAIGRAGQASRFVSSELLRNHFGRLGRNDPLSGFTAKDFVADYDGDWGRDGEGSSDDEVTAVALRDLESERPSDLLWLHYFGLHEWSSGERTLGSNGAAELYDAALERLDRSLAPLLAERDRLTLVLLADHGEGLGARGIVHHANFVFEELTHIPLLVRVPGVKPAAIEVPLGSTCVYNTLRALRGLEADEAADPSVLGFVNATDVGTGPGFASFDQSQWALLYGTQRLVYTPRQRLVELYDLNLDPSQRSNVAEAQPELASQLLARLFELRTEPPR